MLEASQKNWQNTWVVRIVVQVILNLMLIYTLSHLPAFLNLKILYYMVVLWILPETMP